MSLLSFLLLDKIPDKCGLRGIGFNVCSGSPILVGKPRGRSLRRSLTLHKQSGNTKPCSLSPRLQPRERCHPQWAGLPTSVKTRPSRRVQRLIPLLPPLAQVILELFQLTTGNDHHKSRQSECHQLTDRGTGGNAKCCPRSQSQRTAVPQSVSGPTTI